MYLLLLVFGGVLSAGGAVLAVSGISLRDGTFDTATLTPGIVAAVGGLLLIGIGAGLRTLQRIERTLASRPMPRALPTAEGQKAVEGAEAPRDWGRVPFVPKVTPDDQAAVASGDIFGAKPLETASVADKVSLPVIAIATAHEAIEARTQISGKNGNGAGGMRGLRLPTRLRPANVSERQSEPTLAALWPKGPRTARTAEAASVPIAQSAGVTAPQSPYGDDASNSDNPQNAAAGISILKSGIVNDMPYTLFSDGSIEAQLPEGTLRFGSITELRSHIEQSA
jgi:hypothetical protein